MYLCILEGVMEGGGGDVFLRLASSSFFMLALVLACHSAEAVLQTEQPLIRVPGKSDGFRERSQLCRQKRICYERTWQHDTATAEQPDRQF